LFCYFVMGHPKFVEAQYDTHFIKDYFKGASDMDRLDEVGGPEIAALVAGLMHVQASNRKQQPNGKASTNAPAMAGDMSGWWIKRRP